MAIINDLTDFKKLTSNITSFSHAYLFKVNDLNQGYNYSLEFAKEIICENLLIEDRTLVEHQLENNEYDDLYVVNPKSISINVDEVNKLLNYMETKSLRQNGRRVYIIYGFERLTREVSNKILKFLEEPNDNIYGILLTADIDKVLPTIVSRCQVLSLTFNVDSLNEEGINKMKKYIEMLYEKKEKTIAFNIDFFKEDMLDREKMYTNFDIIEKLLSNNIKLKNNIENNNVYVCPLLQEENEIKLINFMRITNKIKKLFKTNNNLSLLLDRYIIEVARELRK